MKRLIGIIFAFAAMAFADDEVHNGTGFFVNSEYIVTAYHVVEGYENTCYYDIQNDTCYQVHVVDYTVNPDLALLKLDEDPVELPWVCRIAHTELPIGEKLTSYGYPEPFVEPELTIIPLNIRLLYRSDGNDSFYRMTGKLRLGMSGGPNFTTDGQIGAMNKSISTDEQNTSNVVKSTEVIRMLNKNGVKEYPNTKNVKKCVISILNTAEVFKSAHLKWGV
jgi:S1-C subfamily serine protease